MQIGFFFNRHGIVVVCGVADSDGRRVRTLELDEASKVGKRNLLPSQKVSFNCCSSTRKLPHHALLSPDLETAKTPHTWLSSVGSLVVY